MALQHNIVPDSADYFRVLESALHHYGHLPPQQPMQPAPPPAAPMPPPMLEPVHTAHVDLEHVEHDHEPDEAHMYSAPVSRGEAGPSVEPQMTPSSVRLSPEQRDMAAHRSMPHLSHDQAERTYATAVLKLGKMTKSKLISE
jgi:hypothetical protein